MKTVLSLAILLFSAISSAITNPYIGTNIFYSNEDHAAYQIQFNADGTGRLITLEGASDFKWLENANMGFDLNLAQGVSWTEFDIVTNPQTAATQQDEIKTTLYKVVVQAAPTLSIVLNVSRVDTTIPSEAKTEERPLTNVVVHTNEIGMNGIFIGGQTVLPVVEESDSVLPSQIVVQWNASSQGAVVNNAGTSVAPNFSWTRQTPDKALQVVFADATYKYFLASGNNPENVIVQKIVGGEVTRVFYSEFATIEAQPATTLNSFAGTYIPEQTDGVTYEFTADGLGGMITQDKDDNGNITTDYLAWTWSVTGPDTVTAVRYVQVDDSGNLINYVTEKADLAKCLSKEFKCQVIQSRDYKIVQSHGNQLVLLRVMRVYSWTNPNKLSFTFSDLWTFDKQ